MRESFILPRVTLAVTKRHFWVCHTRQMCSWYLCRDKNLRQFARTIYQFNIPVTDDMFNVVDISESEFSLLGSLCSLLLQFCQETSFTWSSVRSLLIATTTWYSGFFLLSFVTRFACDIGWPIGKELVLDLNFIWGHHHLHLVGMNDLSTSWLIHNLLHRASDTQQGRNSCPRLQFLAFNLDSVMISDLTCQLETEPFLSWKLVVIPIVGDRFILIQPLIVITRGSNRHSISPWSWFAIIILYSSIVVRILHFLGSRDFFSAGELGSKAERQVSCL